MAAWWAAVAPGLFDELLLLALLAHSHRRKVGQSHHETAVFLVEGVGAAVGHHKDRAPSSIRLPREQDAVSYQRCFDAHQIEKFLPDAKALRTYPRSRQTPQALG